MKKRLITLMFILTLLFSVLMGTLYFGTVEAATNITGVIGSDTTWTKVGSPYIFTGPVLVDDGVTLTIEPGVSVNLGSYYIQINGTLRAKGSSIDPIYLNGGRSDPSEAIVFTQASSNWTELTSSGCLIENAILNLTSIQVEDASPKINNNTFENSYISVAGGSLVISNNTFLGSDHSIVLNPANATISGNRIVGGSTAMWIEVGLFEMQSFPVIEGNLIAGNEKGIVLISWADESLESPIIRNNTIADNNYGISFEYISVGLSPIIMNNNIYNNSNYNIDLSHDGSGVLDPVNATYNWWGTTDTQVINQTMHDFYDDFTLGTVTFVPFLTEANPDAPLVPDFPSPLIISILLASILVASLIFKRNAGTKKVKPQTSSAGVTVCFNKLKH